MILSGIIGVLLFGLLCLLVFLLPGPTQYFLSKRIINKRTGKPLVNNNFKFPLGDVAYSTFDAAFIVMLDPTPTYTIAPKTHIAQA